ncbi:hypothetical protein [Microbulbifer discodermiae]|uniref:hypothetical protein n=1 Tax=Microbulbifer sp. 2201CG32-9 TaxID=3232309 RepID=UPI00345C550C
MKIMSNRSLIIILTCFMLAGCPPASWHIQSDADPTFAVSDTCIRSATNFEGVMGIVKLDFDRADDNFERFLIETEYGVANLDLEFKNNGIPVVHLYLHGGGVNPRSKAQEGGKQFLNKLIQHIQQSCASHS